MLLKNHFHEPVAPFLKLYDSSDHKVALWNAFVDTDLTGINDDDCAILPRVLPLEYLSTIRKAAHDITLFCLKLLSLPPDEIRAIIPNTPIRDFLIEELEVLRYRPERLVGSMRFDMALVGAPRKNNPPKLLEINEIGFDGLARSSCIQEILFRLIPELRKKCLALDTAKAEARNMSKLAGRLARFHYDWYNWEEEVMMNKARIMGVEIFLTSPLSFKCKVDKSTPLLVRESVQARSGKLKLASRGFVDAYQMGFSFEHKDYLENASFYRDLVRSRIPQYSPFITGLVASKMILVLLSDPHLRRKFLGSARRLEDTVLPATKLSEQKVQIPANHDRLVLKHVDGMGGEKVFVGRNKLAVLKKIRQREHWILQKRVALNTLRVRGILSPPRKVIADLGVFIQYDWARGKFRDFGVGGFITRGTNRSFTVNVSGGGIQVPVMFLR